jgi:5-methyltetrahydropteroyltriglutamate--homocysteine methyltransferase
VFETVKLPENKVLIPGVLESKTNFIEHPELVAQRLARFARLVGRENVIAGSDCGYGTWVGQAAVDPAVVWAKFAAMAKAAAWRPGSFGPSSLSLRGTQRRGNLDEIATIASLRSQ